MAARPSLLGGWLRRRFRSLVYSCFFLSLVSHLIDLFPRHIRPQRVDGLTKRHGRIRTHHLRFELVERDAEILGSMQRRQELS